MPDPSEKTRTRALVVIATLAVIAALYFAADFLIPIAMALVLNALLRPVVRGMERLHIPTPVAAGILVLALGGLIYGLGWGAAGPIKKWVNEAPQHFAAAEQKLAKFRAPIEKLSSVVSNAQKAVQGPTSSPSTQQAPAASPAPVQPPGPLLGVSSQLLGTTTQIVGGLAEVLMLLLLLLASGGLFLQKLHHILRRGSDKDKADDVVREAEHVTMRYVLATAMINLGQGTVIALLMWWLGMPTPVLWGIFTFIFEFVPYLGAAAMMVLIGATSLATFDGVGKILLPPAAYLIVTTLQNNLVSPVAYGRQLKLNAVAVLIGVLFWWYVWGIAGAFLAVPIIAMAKVFASRVERLRPLCEFLSE